MDVRNPLTFVGPFDSRSVALAVLITAPWLLALAWGRLRSGWIWVAVVTAAVLFPFSIAWVQVPVQQAVGAFWQATLDAEAIRRYTLLVGLPSVAVSGLVQEGVKLLVAIGALRLMPNGLRGRKALAAGAAAGAGYGGMEAFWVFNTIFASGWSWATVDLHGWQALLGFIERILTVPFHIAIAALAAYGYSRGRGFVSYLLAAAAHTAANYVALVLQVGLLNVTWLEVWVAVLASVSMGWALWLRWRRESGD